MKAERLALFRQDLRIARQHVLSMNSLVGFSSLCMTNAAVRLLVDLSGSLIVALGKPSVSVTGSVISLKRAIDLVDIDDALFEPLKRLILDEESWLQALSRAETSLKLPFPPSSDATEDISIIATSDTTNTMEHWGQLSETTLAGWCDELESIFDTLARDLEEY